ncbi:MAG: hypothetical protein MK060_15740 [Blastomonas sp.]|uniref:hypothetical protein n=2 Tax=unclassified Blastomonas TaxID=2626550 RepID=UPI00406A5E14|nr:hypothetical protein [Blastomonas sp.]
MQIEQIDRDAAADYLEARGERALALRARNVGGTLAEAFARHRISALSARPASNYVMVREIETVTGDFCTEPGEPFYRIEIDGFCADFDYREAADNFAAAINARIGARPADSDMVERVQDMLVAAYKAGATAVHNSWVEGTNGSEPDFYEAASDYARAAIAAITGESAV